MVVDDLRNAIPMEFVIQDSGWVTPHQGFVLEVIIKNILPQTAAVGIGFPFIFVGNLRDIAVAGTFWQVRV